MPAWGFRTAGCMNSAATSTEDNKTLNCTSCRMLFPKPEFKREDESVLFHVLASLTRFKSRQLIERARRPNLKYTLGHKTNAPKACESVLSSRMVEALEAREKSSGRGVLHISERAPYALLSY